MLLINILKTITSHPLNRGKKLSAILKFIKWQLGSRLISSDVIYNWVNGSKVIVRTGETGFTGNIYCGLHEFADMAFLLHSLREDDLFIDVGANIGSYTLLACAAVGASGYAFEPAPDTYAKLIANIHLNKLENRVTTYNLALGSSSGNIKFSSRKNCMNHVIIGNDTDTEAISVKVSTLDDELKDSPFFLKIDVEGYETHILEGAKKTLSNESLCCVILELNGSGQKYGFDETEILKTMHDYGFQTYTYQPFVRKLISLEGKNLSQGNTLFIRNADLVIKRIKSAPAVYINKTAV